MYILTNRNDAEFLKIFSTQLGEYAEPDGRLFGAYGHRMRVWFGYDQLQTVIDKLKTNPKDRQAVIGLWSPGDDLLTLAKDHPCNMMVLPRIQPDGRVSLTVYNRSNDMLWGAIGANVVQFSFLLQYIAMSLGREIGFYHQVTNNPHVYTDFGSWKKVSSLESDKDKYSEKITASVFEEHSPSDWDSDLKTFMQYPGADVFYKTLFFNSVVTPMWRAHSAYKLKNKIDALNYASMISAEDWCVAATLWLNRRKL